MRRLRVAIAVVSVIALAAACAPPRPPETAPYLRERVLQRVSEDLSTRVEVPYELPYEIQLAVDKRLSPTGGERRRLENIIDFIFGWLDLSYSLTPTLNATETFRRRQGNCLSFVNLFVGVARRQRLNPFYVEVEDYQRWNYRDGVVVSRGHIVAGVYIDGKLETFDFLPYRPKSYRDFEPIDDLTATAHFYNNLGAEALMADRLDEARPNLEIAVQLAPDFDKALNNLGIALLRTGEAEQAVEIYRRGLELDPANVPLLTNLARTYQEMGRAAEADRLLSQLEQISDANPFFYLYRGERALALGNYTEALGYMRDALKRDSEVPEVHVGLARVYFAMGEVKKAEHHVERALKLDATHAEARKYAAMIHQSSGR